MEWFARHRRWWIVLAIVVVALVVVRLLLEGWVARYLNGKLDRMGDYHGQLADVDLHLWRGAYSIDGLEITRRKGKAPPLLEAPRIDLSVSWRALLHGGIVGRVVFTGPTINFIDAPATQNGKGVDWRERLESLMPIRLDEVRVVDGTVRFRALSTKPPVDLKATAFNGTITNLSNVRDRGPRPATLDATARILGQAPLEAHADLDPLGSLRDFAFRVKVTGIDLTKANDFLQAYAKVDVESGKGDFVMELDAKDGRLRGYAKPLFRHVEIFNWKQDVEEQGDNPFRAAWEALAGGVQNLFKNQQEDQFATRIELSGRIGNTNTSAWSAIVAVLRNAFVQAFKPRFEDLPTRGPGDEGDD